jgi:hypothetical protein
VEKRFALVPHVIIALALCACASTPRAVARIERSTLHVEGDHLAVESGSRVRLLGVNHSGSEYACIEGRGFFEGPSDDALARAIVAWNANTVRLPLNEDCWLGINGVPPDFAGDAYRDAIRARVAHMRAHGLFVVLDLHWSAPGATLARGQVPMADADHAPDFWRSVAATFASDTGVVFDLFNEPFVASWECWLDGCTIAPSDRVASAWRSAGMQELLDAVRSTGARNVVLAGGLAYANDLHGWIANAPRDPLAQLAVSFHLYSFNPCREKACWDAELAPLAARVPVVTSELGEDDCAHGFIDSFMSWADARGISYLGWTWNTWSCERGPALVTSYDGTPTRFGEGLRAHLRGLAR